MDLDAHGWFIKYTGYTAVPFTLGNLEKWQRDGGRDMITCFVQALIYNPLPQ